MKQATKPKRGGKREGSGRKPKGKERFTLYLTASRVEAVRVKYGDGKVSETVDEALLTLV